jgi:molybdopterin-containing oxidoreductase family membrane subunit
MVVFAAIGAFLSFFHQGSLGGLFGVLQGRPFAWREGLAIWPSTFFLFIVSAIAAGPSFLIVVTSLVSALTRKRLVKPEVYGLLAKLSGTILIGYLLLKGLDTLVWLNKTAPNAGFQGYWFYQGEPFGSWILFVELVLLGLVPAVILVRPPARHRARWRLLAALAVCLGVALNRFVMTIQTLALPTLPFEPVWDYWPSWQEFAAFAAVVAYGVILYSVSYRYLKLYPQERELQDSRGEAV